MTHLRALRRSLSRFTTRTKVEEGVRVDVSAEVREARFALAAARSYFNEVTEPDLVEHAVHLVKAAEVRYSYLLKSARRAFALSRESQVQAIAPSTGEADSEGATEGFARLEAGGESIASTAP